MGCGCAGPFRHPSRVAIYKDGSVSGSKKMPEIVSPLQNVSILFTKDADGSQKNHSTSLKPKEPVVANFSEDKVERIKEKDSTVLELADITSDMRTTIRASKDFTPHEKETLHINIWASPEKTRIDQAPHLEQAKQVSDISVSDQALFKNEDNSEIEALVSVKQELHKAESNIVLKDEKISKLLAENFRLKREVSKAKVAKVHSPQTQKLQTRVSSMRERRRAIKKSTEIATKTLARLNTQESFLEKQSSSERAVSVHTKIDSPLPRSDLKIADEPILSFKTSSTEAKLQRASGMPKKEKPTLTDWQYSEIMVL